MVSLEVDGVADRDQPGLDGRPVDAEVPVPVLRDRAQDGWVPVERHRIDRDDGAPLVYGDANGWTLRTQTQVELLGGACQQIKNPATGGIKFDFPCDVFVPR